MDTNYKYGNNNYISYGGVINEYEFDTTYPLKKGYWSSRIISDLSFERWLEIMSKRRERLQ